MRAAVRSMADISAEMVEKAGYTVEDIDIVIPHQANQRITDAVASRLGVPDEKVYSNIAEMGNTDTDQIKLHFEIRRLGKPVDPLKYLPGDRPS